MNTAFQINNSQVVCETIDGEVVIVNLEKGYYYSLLKTGAEIWSGIEQRIDRLSIIQNLTQTYEGKDEEIATAVDEFLDHLLNEELILRVANRTPTAPGSNGEKLDNVGSEAKPPFEKPVLEKFTDMEDLLLLDPIHEVDVEAGWPNAKAV